MKTQKENIIDWLISVDRYLERGEHAGRLDEAFITKIE
jgi:hypothetical protein